MASPKLAPLVLSDDACRVLEGRTRCRKTARALRSPIILASAGGTGSVRSPLTSAQT
ncbi:MAG TPA: hypothetical protein VN969_30080 [Streptosporangiaceae bacterium]|nr:hypothetical protein [Streptosporangiaceae bacterium]